MNLHPQFFRHAIRSNPLNLFVIALYNHKCNSSYLNGLVFSPTFFNLSLNFAIRSSWSEAQWIPSLVFADYIRASPSSAAKNIINLVLVLTIWWCPCVESSLLLLEEGVFLWPVGSLGKTLLAFALLQTVLQGQICLLLQVFLDFLLLHSSPL